MMRGYESKFTKGPRRRVSRLNNSDSSNNDKLCGIEGGDDDFIVAEVCADVPEHEANAYLMAAALELYEALKEILEYYPDSLEQEDKSKFSALLAKAEGKESTA